MRLTVFVVAIIGSVLGLNGAVLYQTTPISSSLRFSDYGENSGSGFRTFDSFTLSADSNVQTITWRAMWVDLATPQPAPAPAPDVTSWQIGLWGSGAVPGAALSQYSFAAADVSSTFLGLGTFSFNGLYNVAFYDYSATLPAGFVATGGTEYWLSILSLSPTLNPNVAWVGASGGNSSSYQQVLGAGLSVTSGSAVAADRVFRLDGEINIPEPGTWGLAGGALILLTLRRRMRR